MTISIDDAAAQLYGGPLDGFVASRDALAKEVRAGGDRDTADGIKALRKPTVAADALNRAIRADPVALDRLLDAVDRLRRTQEAMLAGDPVDFGADQASYRRAVDAVASGATSNEIEIRAALEAAAVGGLITELRAAAFVSLPQPTGGFGPFEVGPGSVAPGPAGRARGDGSEDGERRGPRGGDPARSAGKGPSAAERRMAERVRRAAEQAVAAAEAEHRQAVEDAAAATDQLAVVDADLADLAERVEAARRARDDVMVTRAEAEAALARASTALDDARAALEQLGPPDR